MNEYSLYSPWAEKSFSITTIKPTKPIVDIYNNVYNVTLLATDPTKNIMYTGMVYL